VSFLDILAEDIFQPEVALDKFVMFDKPKFSAYFWNKMRNVKIWEVVTFINEPPQYFPNCMPPAFFVVPPRVRPPPTMEGVPTFCLR